MESGSRAAVRPSLSWVMARSEEIPRFSTATSPKVTLMSLSYLRSYCGPHTNSVCFCRASSFGVPFLSASRSKQELLHVNCSAHDSCSIDTSQRHVSVNSSDIEETLLNRAAEDSSSSASMQPRPKTSC